MNANPVNFTPQAINALVHLKSVLKVSAETGIRLGIKKGSEGNGPSFIIGFDEKQPSDLEYEVNGLKILMHKTESMHLLGITIDYSGSEGDGGFIFRQ